MSGVSIAPYRSINSATYSWIKRLRAFHGLANIRQRHNLPMSNPQIIEGVFAIHKPPNRSSAQLVNHLKSEFTKSALFKPLINAHRSDFSKPRHLSDRRNKGRNKPQLKIGHGGTLDPNATGVLVIGVGAGTKSLQSFLINSTKTYEATVLFGAATDSYDTDGKVLKRAPFQHITRESVEDALQQFRGKGKQRPPLYSALKMDGKRLCDYAREGREIPREIERRDVDVKELEILEWLEGGEHGFEVGEEEADRESKIVAEKVLGLGDGEVGKPDAHEEEKDVKQVAGAKRKRSLDADSEDDDGIVVTKKPALGDAEADSATLMHGGIQSAEDLDMGKPEQPSLHDNPPAVKLRMTVSSGFYVRSLAHDLGEAVGSLACMCALVRTRQGDFELGKNALDFEDLERGEEVWGPKVGKLIADSETSKST